VIAFRPATSADIEKFYGDMPRETLRVLVITLDEEPVGLIGMAVEKGRYRAFSEYKPALEPHLKSMTVRRAMKAAQRMYAEAKLPVYALQEKDSGILLRVGFQPISDGVYLWHS
jgi:hypothetical protein